MIENIEIQWLLSFQAVYEKMSFKQAAQQLQLPSSNVSRHVALLEQQLNMRLLQRSTRKMTATVAGSQLYASLTPLLAAMDHAIDEVALHGDSLRGVLKIISPDLPFLADIFTDFCVQHPHLQLQCDTQLNPQQGMIEGFDVVLRFGRGRLSDCAWVAKEMIRWPSCVVAAPVLLQRICAPSTVAKLSRLPCISSFSVLEGMPWRFKGGHIAQVDASYKVNSGHIAMAAALRGLGLAILPKHACADALAAGTLVALELDQDPEDLVLYAYYAGGQFALQKVKVFLRHLETQLANVQS
ncbi:LysR family transcriptional regulator [Pseudoalteromonas sp. T1lg22]|uniref:LysR family transcriptional regulator n=1 Tax=Pseudoalteromonas sp. T1lg22 TaxID=2077096 RepID=UPI000CF73F91|nr:LysR family transcriptional regulator [Pseudoalteromonas sp. T1lg22]